ncbi:MAG TPA: PxKF domain-containing protein [Pyrinomonadaceae bacterium]|nr:PxKF domain-containing protein [Pyrinomonadaceae bacterium]
MPQAAPGVETIDTFEVVGGVCTNTPKDTFSLGDTVCARVENAPLRSPVAARRVNFNNTAGVNSQSQDVTTDPQTFTFTLPTADTTVVDGENIDNRGIWSVSTNALDNGTRAIAYFSVTDPQNSAADVVIYSASASGVDPVAPGGSAGISLWVSNNGPDAAQDVHVTQQVPNNLTFVSATSDSGPSFNCSESGGVVDCSLASLPSGQKATFTINYTVSSSAPNSLVTVRSEIASDQEDPRLASNTADARLEIRGGSGPAATCGLACPADLRVTADTTNGNGDPGAIVNFSGNIEPVGEDCGAITSTPASGSFFPVGDTVVEVTSAGGGSCSFTVTVTNIAPPTISCGANIGVTAADGECDAEVNVTAPTGTADDAPATAEGSRSDGQALTARYPAGTTTITWTITDSINRTASCQQTVTVTVNDTTPPTITAPPDVTVSTPDGTSGNCGVVVGEGALGTPTTDDNCSASLNVWRTGVPSGNFFPVGTTTITYTVKDSANNTATATQKVTVIETTAPHIAAPPDASYTCLSEVPAANPSQATSGVVLDENGNPLPPGPPSDNCGTPVVTVTETTSGAGNPSSPLIITRVFTATDAAGNSASSTQTITVIDPTPPTISCPADITVYLPLNSTAVSTPVNFSASGSDNCGSPNITYSQAPGSNFPVGTTAVTATATDAGGNSVSCTFNVTVLYNFTGFFSPVNNLPTFNVVNAGRAIPVKFSLSGNKGLNIFATGSPASGTIACNSSDPAVDLLGTVTAGGSSLSYDASSDQYNYVWKTESSWAGTCRQLVLTLNDGSVHRANFKFK